MSDASFESLDFSARLRQPGDQDTAPEVDDSIAEQIAALREEIEALRLAGQTAETSSQFYAEFTETLNQTLSTAQEELKEAEQGAADALEAAALAVQEASEAWDSALAAHDALGQVQTDITTLEAKAVTSSTTEYAVSSDESTAPTSGWSTTPPDRTPGTFVWTRTRVTYADDTVSPWTEPFLQTGNTGPSLYTWVKYADDASGTGLADEPANKSYIGIAYNQTSETESTDPEDYSWSLIQGSVGEDGRAVLSTEVTYQASSSGTEIPTGTWVGTPPAAAPGQYIWTRTTFHYDKAPLTSDTYSVGKIGETGTSGRGIVSATTEYQLADSGTVTPVGTWSPDPLVQTTALPFLWSRTTTTYTSGSPSVGYSVSQRGSDAAPAPTISLSALTQVLVSPSTGTGATTPTSTTVTGTANNTSITVWEYATNGGAFAATPLPAGVTRSGNVVTIVGGSLAAGVRTVAVRASGGGVSDTLTVAKVLNGAAGGAGSPGADAITVLLTNQAHTFAGANNLALADSTTTDVLAFKGSTPVSVEVGTIGGQIAGKLTASVAGDNTTSPTITINASATLDVQHGELTIPLTVDGKTFSQTFSWSVAFTGRGISSTDVTYQASTSGTTPPSGGTWSANPPTAQPGQYVWSRTITTYTSGPTSTAYSVGKIGENGTNGSDGVGVSGTEIRYQTGSSGTVPPGGTWVEDPPAASPGQYVWTRTITSYTNSTSTTAYSVGRIGSDGDPGDDGVGISSTEVRYQLSSSGTANPTGTWSDTPLVQTAALPYLWTRTVITYTDTTTSTAYSVARRGDQGDAGRGIASTLVEYAIGASATQAPTSGWGTDVLTPTVANPYLWTRTTVTYTTGTPATSILYSVSKMGADGAKGDKGDKGDDGAPAKVVSLTSTTQVLTAPATGGTTSPATAVVTGTAANMTIGYWAYSVNGAAFSTTLPTGVTRSGNVVTITGSTMTARTISVKMAESSGASAPSDTITVAKVQDGATGAPGSDGSDGAPGADAITPILSNESHTFPGSVTAALAGTTTTTIIAYKGATRVPVTVDSISGATTGISAAVTSGSGTNTVTITVTATTALVALSGKFLINMTIDGKAITREFSWSVSRAGAKGDKGDTGNTGNTGSAGVSVTKITPLYQQRAQSAGNPTQPANTVLPNPPTGWTTTEPAWVANTKLFRIERVEYSNSTVQYTPWTDVSSYALASAAKGELDTLVNTTLPALNDELDAAAQAAADAASMAERGLNLINNTSRSGTVDRWTRSLTSTNLSAETVDFNGRPVTAMKYDATGNPQVYSDYFDVDVTKAYEVRMWVLDPTLVSGTQFYLGLNTRAGAATTTATPVARLTGAALAPSNNIYFYSTANNTPAWTEYVAYFLPHGFTPADAKGLGKNVTNNVIFSDPATTSARVRVLNYSNGTGRRDLWLAHMTVTETTAEAIVRAQAAQATADATSDLTTGWTKTGTTQIDGGAIYADSVTAAQIAADTITANEIASRTILASNIKANEVTANEMKTGTITAASGIIGEAAIQTAHIENGAITNLKVSDLNVSKLEGTAADFTSTFTETLLANNAFIDNLAASRLVVGASPNLIKLGNLQSNTAPNIDRVTGGWATQQVGTANPAFNGWNASYGMSISAVGPHIVGNPFELKRGQKYTFSATARSTSSSKQLRVEAVRVTRNGTTGPWSVTSDAFDIRPMSAVGTANTTVEISNTGTAQADGTYFLRFSFNTVSGTFYINDLRLVAQLKGTLIENGTITSDKLNVTSAWIGDLISPNIITTKLVGETITGTTISGSTITGNTISGGTINSVTLNSATINSGSITMSKPVSGGISSISIAVPAGNNSIEFSYNSSVKGFIESGLNYLRVKSTDLMFLEADVNVQVRAGSHADIEASTIDIQSMSGGSALTGLSLTNNRVWIKGPEGTPSLDTTSSATTLSHSTSNIRLTTASSSIDRDGNTVFESNSSLGTQMTYLTSLMRVTASAAYIDRGGTRVFDATGTSTQLFASGSNPSSLTLANSSVSLTSYGATILSSTTSAGTRLHASNGSGTSVILSTDVISVTRSGIGVFGADSNNTSIASGNSNVTLSNTNSMYYAGNVAEISGAVVTITGRGPAATRNSWDFRSVSTGGITKTALRFSGGSANMPTTTISNNMYMHTDGYVYVSSSSAKNKVDVRDISTDPIKVLDVAVRDWYDREEAESYAALLDGDETSHVIDGGFRRIPGVVAEELEDIGLQQFVTYGPDGEPNGVMYERIALLLIPVVKEQQDRLDALENLVQELTN